MFSNDQEKAWNLLISWIEENDPREPFFILGGFAGTGKTYLLQYLNEQNYSNMYFTATTNKAAKVVSDRIGFIAVTIYSALGLRLEDKEDKQILIHPKKLPYFPKDSIIIVDEASMISKELYNVIIDTVCRLNVRFIFVGDPGQLPPIGEKYSKIWKTTENFRIVMEQVMRNDNQLLALATNIRQAMKNKVYINPIVHDVGKDGKGIYIWPSRRRFEEKLLSNINNINFQETKIIAWTNNTIGYYNDLIRDGLGYNDRYVIGDVILLKRPIERDDELIAHTDDEFVIDEIKDGRILIEEDYYDFWQLKVTGSQNLTLRVPKNEIEINELLDLMKSYAFSVKGKERQSAWNLYWRTRRTFDEIRYGYALTAHRAQGSTLKNCYIDQRDILRNSKDLEAFQCLYVAVTRPTDTIHTY